MEAARRLPPGVSAEHPRDPTADSGQERDLERFVTLIDAVVAIAITLLVLPLAEMTVDLGADQSVADLLDEHQAGSWPSCSVSW